MPVRSTSGEAASDRRDDGPACLLDKGLEGITLALLVTLPLLFNPFMGRSRDAFTGTKTALLEIGAASLTLVWTICAAARFRRSAAAAAARDPLVRFPPFNPIGAVLTYALVWCLATAFSVNPAASVWGTVEAGGGLLSQLSTLVVFLALRRPLRRPGGVGRVTRALVAPSVAICLFGLVQAAGLDALDWASDSPSPAISTLGRSNVVGAYLAAMAPLTLGAILERTAEGAAGARIAGLVAVLLLQTAGLLVSLSRAGWLGFTGGILVCLGLAARGRRSASALLAIVAVAAAALYPVIERGWSPEQADGSSFTDKRAASVRSRLIIWEETLSRAEDHWFLGYGPATFETIFARDYPDRLLELRPWAPVDDPHNLLLAHLIDTGVLGLLALAALFGSIVARGLSLLRSLDSPLLAGALGSATAFLIAAQFNRSEVVTWVLFWAVLALVAWHPGAPRRARRWALQDDAPPVAGFGGPHDDVPLRVQRCDPINLFVLDAGAQLVRRHRRPHSFCPSPPVGRRDPFG